MREIFIYGILLFIFCGSGKEQKFGGEKKEFELSQKKSILIVIAHRDFRDEEFKEPYELLKNSGFKVIVASTDTTPAKGMLGMTVNPEILIPQAIPDSFVALIIVGGTGCKELWYDRELHGIVNKFYESQKTIAAICIAPMVLARAGILKDKKVTVYPGVADEIKPLCGEYTGKDLEISGNVITGAGPQVAKNFARAILEAIAK